SDPIFLCQIGRLALKIDAWLDAEQAFLSAIDLAPNLHIPYKWLGILYEQTEEFEKAQGFFNKCLEIKQSASVFTLLGSVQQKLGMIEGARKSFEKALEIDPNYEEAMYNLALILIENQPNEAANLLEKSIKLDPNYACAYRELGWLFRKWDENNEAEQYIKKAI